MWILDQDKKNLYRLENINTISLYEYVNNGSINIGSTQLGYYKDKDMARQVYQNIINWLVCPYQNGMMINIFYMPEDKLNICS